MLKQYINKRKPETAVILGSGLHGLCEEIDNKIEIPYEKLGIPCSRVKGHSGKFVLGEIEDKEILFLNGRIHLYEGISPSSVFDLIALLKDVGIKHLIVTNAAGSLNQSMKSGSIMMICDHINFALKNPLVGNAGKDGNPMFTDMVGAYDKDYAEDFERLAKEENIKLYKGVYLWTLGPNFETPAEIKMFKLLGADAVGMSTVPEVLAARYFNIKVSGFSVITNMGAGMEKGSLSHEQTLSQAKKGAESLKKLLKSFFLTSGNNPVLSISNKSD